MTEPTPISDGRPAEADRLRDENERLHARIDAAVAIGRAIGTLSRQLHAQQQRLVDVLRIEACEQRTRAEQAETARDHLRERLTHSDQLADAYHAEAGRMSDRYDAMRHDHDQLRMRLDDIGETTVQWATRSTRGTISLGYKPDAIPTILRLNPTATPVTRHVGHWRDADEADRG